MLALRSGYGKTGQQNRSKRVRYDHLDAKKQRLRFLQPENLKVAFQIETDDTPIVFSVVIDAERRLIRMIAGYSITFPKERRVDGAIAICSTNCNLVAGGFDFDYETGSVVFRISASFAGSIISPDAFLYMVHRAYSACALYDKKLDLLAKGELSLAEYLYLLKTIDFSRKTRKHYRFKQPKLTNHTKKAFRKESLFDVLIG